MPFGERSEDAELGNVQDVARVCLRGIRQKGGDVGDEDVRRGRDHDRDGLCGLGTAPARQHVSGQVPSSLPSNS